jgi:hypothetical protein
MLYFRASWESQKRTFTNNGVKEIHTTKGARHNGVNVASSAFETDTGIASNMGEDVLFAHFD